MDQLWNIILIFLMTFFYIQVGALLQTYPQDPTEYCEWESFNATCKSDEIVLIENARYGRMRLGRCVNKNYGHIGCGTDVMGYFDEQCSGRRQCLISVISLHNKRACPKDFKSYLEATYSCMKVSKVPPYVTCRKPGNYTTFTAVSGIIPSVGTIESGLGGRNCPWKISVAPHQKINLTLVDFSNRINMPYSPSQEGTQRLGCFEYATIFERTKTKGIINRTVCGVHEREKHVYISVGNHIEIQINPMIGTSTDQKYFILKYEAIGCPPIEPSKNAWLRTDGIHAIIQCNATEEAWYLTCKGTEWVGHVGNCSDLLGVPENEEVDWTISQMFQNVTSFPYGLLIVVALGVAIGVAIGVVMLVLVLAYLRRRRRRRVRSRSNYLLKTISQGESEPGSKANEEYNADTNSMLIRRENLTEEDRNYLNTWQMRSSIPVSKTEENMREISREMPQTEITIPNISSTLPRSMKTFKPELPSSSSTSNHPRSHSHDQFDSGLSSTSTMPLDCSDSPYYFKLDPIIMRSDKSPTGAPDVLNGCAECRALTLTRKKSRDLIT